MTPLRGGLQAAEGALLGRPEGSRAASLHWLRRVIKVPQHRDTAGPQPQSRSRSSHLRFELGCASACEKLKHGGKGGHATRQPAASCAPTTSFHARAHGLVLLSRAATRHHSELWAVVSACRGVASNRAKNRQAGHGDTYTHRRIAAITPRYGHPSLTLTRTKGKPAEAVYAPLSYQRDITAQGKEKAPVPVLARGLETAAWSRRLRRTRTCADCA